MSGESLEDIAKENGVSLGTGEQEPRQEPQPQSQPVEITRLEAMEKPCGLVWGGGCWTAAWATDVKELEAGEYERQLAGHHLANILDAVMPDHWLRDLDPDSKVARIMVSGAVLHAIIKEKSKIYEGVMAERMAEEAAKGEKPESNAA